jgi:ribonuclease HI
MLKMPQEYWLRAHLGYKTKGSSVEEAADSKQAVSGEEQRPLPPPAPNIGTNTTHQTRLPRHPYQQNQSWKYRKESQQPRRAFKIILQNCNGSMQRRSKWHPLASAIKHFDLDVALLVETNTAWTDHSAKQLQKALQKFLPRPQVITSQSSLLEKLQGSFLPGGTCTITRDHRARTLFILEDPSGMGRWSGLMLQCKNQRRLALIASYRTPTNTTTQGIIATHIQQTAMLQEQGRQNEKPRQAHLDDLKNYIKSLGANTEVVLGIDANETLTNLSPLNQFMEDSDLINPCDIFLDGHTINSYKYGQRQIDHLFISKSLLPVIRAVIVHPFDHFVNSDHRAVEIELDYYCLFHPSSRERHTVRQLYTNNIRSRTKYEQKLAGTLRTRYPHLLNGIDNHATLDNIDEDITKIALSIEKKLGKTSTLWSPRIHNLANVYRYWRLKYQHRKTGMDISTRLARIKDDTQEQFHHKFELTRTVRSHMRQASKELQEARQNAIALRETFLEERIEFYKAEGSKTKANEVANLLRHERLRSLYQQINKYHGQPKEGLKYILAPDQSTVIDNVDGMEDVLIQRNIEHYQQANCTPFAREPLISHFGPHGTNENAEALYQGTIGELPPVNEYTMLVLEQLASDRLPTFDYTISKEEILHVFRHWRESTSTSASGKHLGHYRVFATNPKVLEPNNQDKMNDPQILLHFVYVLLNHSLKTGKPLRRWLKAISVMLEKIPGLPLPAKLRIIHLFEADYGLAGRIIWAQRMMTNAEQHGYLSTEQHGSRRNHQTHDLILLNILQQTFVNQTKTKFCIFDNDATACYDRMTVLLSSLISRNHGVPRSCCELLAATLTSMSYHIATAHGTSSKQYTNSQAMALQGTGQGQALSGPIWTAHHNILHKCYKKIATAARFVDPTGTHQHQSYTGSFVDDAKLYCNNDNEDDNPEPAIVWNNIKNISDHNLMARAQANAQHWEKLLHTLGGKISKEKSHYMTIKFQPDNHGKPMAMNIDSASFPIMLTDSETGTGHFIRQQPFNVGSRTLGVWIALDGSTSEMIQAMTQRSNDIIAKQSKANMSRKTATICHQMIYISAMSYPIVISPIPAKDILQTHSKALKVFLPKMGYQANFPRAVLFAPKTLGGPQIPCLYSIAAYRRATLLLSNMNRQTDAATMIRITLNWQQLITGISVPFLEYPRPLPYLEKNWWTHTRQLFQDHGIQLRIKGGFQPQLARQGDRLIMEQALFDYPKDIYRLSRINMARIYYQVLTLSDLTDNEGTTILPVYFGGNREDIPNRESKLFWPVQEKPSPTALIYWKEFLHSFTNRQKNIRSTTLTHPLGPWTKPNANNCLRYPLISQSKNFLFTKVAEQWYYHHKVPGTKPNHFIKFQKSRIPTARPQTRSIPTDIKFLDQRFHFAINTNCNMDHNDPETDDNWKDNFLPTEIPSAGQQMIFGVDGSFLKNKGTYAWVLQTNEKRTEHSGVTPGYPEQQSARRSELAAILSAVITANEILSNSPDATQTDTRIYCDNFRVVQDIATHQGNAKPIQIYNDYDIILEIQFLLQEHSRTNFQIIHLPKKGIKENWPIENYLHARADALARRRRKETTNFLPLLLPDVPCQIFLHNRPITQNFKNRLKLSRHRTEYFLYLTKKFKWDAMTHLSVDWEPLSSAYLQFPVEKRIILDKIRHGWAYSGYRAHLFGHRSSPTCPFCEEIETFDHIFACQNVVQQSILQEEIQKVRDCLKKQQFDDKRIEIIVILLTQPELLETATRQSIAMSTQREIGLRLFRLGFASRRLTDSLVDCRNDNNQHKKSILMKIVLEFLLKRWERRCTDLYNEESVQRSLLLEEIKVFYTRYTNIPREFRYLVTTPLSEWENRHVSYLQAWIIIKNRLLPQLQRRIAANMPNTITKYFGLQSAPTELNTQVYSPVAHGTSPIGASGPNENSASTSLPTLPSHLGPTTLPGTPGLPTDALRALRSPEQPAVSEITQFQQNGTDPSTVLRHAAKEQDGIGIGCSRSPLQSAVFGIGCTADCHLHPLRTAVSEFGCSSASPAAQANDDVTCLQFPRNYVEHSQTLIKASLRDSQRVTRDSQRSQKAKSESNLPILTQTESNLLIPAQKPSVETPACIATTKTTLSVNTTRVTRPSTRKKQKTTSTTSMMTATTAPTNSTVLTAAMSVQNRSTSTKKKPVAKCTTAHKNYKHTLKTNKIQQQNLLRYLKKNNDPTKSDPNFPT